MNIGKPFWHPTEITQQLASFGSIMRAAFATARKLRLFEHLRQPYESWFSGRPDYC
jgi:hypothetical protein